jgi:hypothetical protein
LAIMTSKTSQISYVVAVTKEFVDMANSLSLHELVTMYETDLDRADESDFTPLPGVPLDYSFQRPQGRRKCREWPGYDCMAKFFAES